MKYEWEKEDIICGRYVCKPFDAHNHKVLHWDAKWSYKIGYYGCGNTKCCLVSLIDGSVTLINSSKEEIAVYLNDNDIIPMSHNRLVETINFLRN